MLMELIHIYFIYVLVIYHKIIKGFQLQFLMFMRLLSQILEIHADILSLLC